MYTVDVLQYNVPEQYIRVYYNNITREIKSTGQRYRVMVYRGQSRRRQEPYNIIIVMRNVLRRYR